MSQEAMEVEEETSTSQILKTLSSVPLSSSLSSLASSSRDIPSNKDFHFYYNFDEFKVPIQQIAAKSQSLLHSIGSSGGIFKNSLRFPGDLDADDDSAAYDWLVNVNDEILERFDVSVDEFEAGLGTGAGPGPDTESGFQLVYGKKKKTKGFVNLENGFAPVKAATTSRDVSGVKVADRKGVSAVKAKVPFHIPTIRRPQDVYNILVNNSNQPFQHVWLESSEDGSRFVHPLEKLSVLDFVNRSVGDVDSTSLLPLESTPFKLVEEVKDLKDLAAKLRDVNEFAVDLEHNQYRSFQGLTCLMQISTRIEDFIIDTLKLRIHVGPYLREVFKDPSKTKVMHGADRDIVWLQRDFGIYVCNLFDTGQASRVLKLERNSLEYLLHHFCGVTANKEYQNADWRLRPLTHEMLRYAREDTHYLLHIHDLMRATLHSMPNDIENSDSPLVEVYKRSYDICMQLYEKELLTESSYLHIYGLQGTGFNAQQLAIVAGLFEWRDVVARAEDESTGYILPNKTLLEIAKQMPFTTSKLHRLLKSKHQYLERNLGSIVSIIRHSMQNAAAFEVAVQNLKTLEATTQHLKEARKASEENIEVDDGCEVVASGTVINLRPSNTGVDSIYGDGRTDDSMNDCCASFLLPKKEPFIAELGSDGQGNSLKHHGENGETKIESSAFTGETSEETLSISMRGGASTSADISPSSKGIGSTVQVQKKPTSGFGALLGSAVAKDKVDLDKKGIGSTVQVQKKPTSGFGALLGSTVAKNKLDVDKKDKEDTKLAKIRSSVNLPFHSFLGGDTPPKQVEEPTRVSEFSLPKEPIPLLNSSSKLEEILALDDDSDPEEVEKNNTNTTNILTEDKPAASTTEMDAECEPPSLSDLSTSFKKCFQSTKQNRMTAEAENLREPSGLLQLKPFDYASARKQVKFGDDLPEDSEEADGMRNEKGRLDSMGGRKSSAAGQAPKDDGLTDFKPGRRRQAFPASGNRSTTFR